MRAPIVSQEYRGILRVVGKVLAKEGSRNDMKPQMIYKRPIREES